MHLPNFTSPVIKYNNNSINSNIEISILTKSTLLVCITNIRYSVGMTYKFFYSTAVWHFRDPLIFLMCVMHLWF